MLTLGPSNNSTSFSTKHAWSPWWITINKHFPQRVDELFLLREPNKKINHYYPLEYQFQIIPPKLFCMLNTSPQFPSYWWRLDLALCLRHRTDKSYIKRRDLRRKKKKTMSYLGSTYSAGGKKPWLTAEKVKELGRIFSYYKHLCLRMGNIP